jgi:hypothetical protein
MAVLELEAHPEDIAKLAAERFGITRPAVHGHLDAPMKEGLIEATLSANLVFVHDTEPGDDWLIEDEENGTASIVVKEVMSAVIKMTMSTDSKRTPQEVFDRYSDPEVDDYAFCKTRVPLRLAQYGQDLLVSRSQARRVLRGSSVSKKSFSISRPWNRSARHSRMRSFASMRPAIPK